MDGTFFLQLSKKKDNEGKHDTNRQCLTRSEAGGRFVCLFVCGGSLTSGSYQTA